MKKFYLFFTFLFMLFGGFTSAFAQDDDVVTIKVMKGQGDWLVANAARTWAAQWQSDATPKVLIKENSGNNNGNGANNMAYWDGTNIQFFNNAPGFGDGLSDDYMISVESGWEFVSVSLNFVASAADKEVYVAVDAEKSEVNNSTSESVHYEVTDIGKSSFVFTVGANAAKFFAKTTDFVITVKEKDPYDVIMDELVALQNEVGQYTADGTTPFHVGSDVGDYGAEEVAAFNEAYEACTAATNNPFYEGTADDLAALRDALQAAYQAVLDSRVPFEVPENLDFITDGYYRFRTGINYNDGNLKYMFTEVTDNGTINGKWGTLDDLANDCNALWQLTKTEEGTWDIVSVATDGRFNNNPATLSEASTHRFVLEGVAQVGEETFINIRYSTVATGKQGYVHQANHGSGAGTGSNLTSWFPTFTKYALGASEWCIEPVSAEEAAKIIEDYAFIKDLEKKKIEYVKMVETSKANLEIAKDNPKVTVDEETKLITDASQFSSPFSDPSEGTDFGALIDDNPATFWHSNWHPSGAALPNHTHYLDVALSEPTHDLIALTITRRQSSNDHITQWGVYGSATPDIYFTQEEIDAAQDGDDAFGKTTKDIKTPGEWHKLADLYTPYGNNTETKTSAPFDTKGYQYLRFWIDGTSNNRGYGHVSEFQLNPATIEIADNAQYKVMGALATNLEKVLSDQIEVEVADLEPEQYNALKAAYDAFMEKFVDPTELRAAIKTAEASTAGIVTGTNPGEWGPDTDAGKLATTVANAKAYDESGDYTPAQSAQYVEDLTAQAGDILASANTIEEGKWYRFHFGSKKTFEANGWDIPSNEATTVKDINDNVYVTNEATWDKIITVAKYDSEEITITISKPTEQDPSATQEQKYTLNKVVPYGEDEDIVRGARLYFDAAADIKDEDCSLFRFVNVGDTAYVLQNKATGLFVGTYSNVRLDVMPSLFKVKAIGYGQNLITATNLITNANQSNLHFQRDNNVVVTWGESAAGSRSGLYIEEVEDVASDYDGTEFLMNLKPGSVNSICYPVGLTVPEDYEMYDVVEVSEGKIKLNPIQEANPGRPFIFIADGDYDTEKDDAEPYIFYHDYSFTKEAITGPLLKGTYNTIASLPKGAITTHANGFVVGDSDVMSEYNVPAHTAYIQTEEMFPLVDYTYEILVEPIEDGISTVLQKVATTGELYTIDGRLISRKANLNDLKRYGKGIYILNGVKVTVK